MKRFLVFLLILIVYFGNISPSNGDAANRVVNDKNILKPVVVNINNLRNMEHVLPTGRKITPVGILNGAPNFAANVAVYHNLVAVLANGATFVQTITIYDKKTLVKIAQYKAFKARRLKFAKKPAIVIYNPKKAKKGEINKAMASFTFAKNSNQDLFQGIAFGPNGILYAAGGGVNDIIALKLINHRLTVIKRYPVKWQKFPKSQYPYQYQGRHKKPHLFYGDFITISKNGKYLYTSGLLSNSVARIDLMTGKTAYANAGAYPFALSLSDNGKRLVVSDWGANGVTVINPLTLKKSGFVSTGEKLTRNSFIAGVHPTAMISIKGTPDVLVTDSNNDRIYEIDSESLKVVKVINDAPYKNAPPGSYPDGVTVINNKIYAANAGNNDVAVFNLKTGARIGLIPTAWYPTAVASTKKSIYIVNAKGLGSGPNTEYQWVGDFMEGAVQKVNINYAFRHIKYLTYRSLKNNGFLSSQRLKRKARNNKITKFLRSHIKHIVFILRENKTFDENFGDYKRAGTWADPHLDLYNRRELPNLYKLANDYGLFVNFMADGEVTAQGHEWTTGASDSDFVQRTWPEYYSGRGLVGNPGWTQDLKRFNIHDHYKYMPIYDSLKALKRWSNPWIAYPERLYIFNDMLKHNVSFEDFGEFVSRNRTGYISNAMKRHIDLKSYGWDRFILDTARANVFLNFAKKRIKEGRFPQFVYIWLPDDHTAGQKSCHYTPDYYVANNDYATGQIIDYLSHSPIWKNTLVFITEDDAQSGADHINAHRTFALMIGPYVKRGAIIGHFYSQVNILKTIEAIFKLPPMSQWDANAAVIRNGFTGRPDMAPFDVMPMRVKPALNPGMCRSKIDKLRLKLGKKGQWEIHPPFASAGIPANEQYTPVSLLKVPGPEQFKQEWIASKGVKSYKKVMAYIKKLAKSENRPIASILAGKLPD
ncbi:MAG: bifunctional YncE family protein/alkaline phosphatase family protein [bacterium]